MARFTVGLDLGQTADYTALGVLEKKLEAIEAPNCAAERPDLSVPPDFTQRDIIRLAAFERGWGAEVEESEGPLISIKQTGVFHLGHLERIRNVSYPSIVTGVAAMMGEPPLRGNATLVIDRTGVGRAVFDMFVDAGLRPVGISIHGGDTVTIDDGGFRVPKRDLVAAVHRFLSERRLKIAPELVLREVLEGELGNFRYKLNAATAHDSYSAWREAEHDDLVLSVAMALWYATQIDRESDDCLPVVDELWQMNPWETRGG